MKNFLLYNALITPKEMSITLLVKKRLEKRGCLIYFTFLSHKKCQPIHHLLTMNWLAVFI